MFQALVVDDKKSIREGLRNHFPWQEAGFALIGAVGSATEAIHIIEEECIDVLLTDIVMPEMSGLELIRSVKVINPDIKVLILSAYDKFEYAQEAIRLGAYSYLTKPVDIEHLKDLLIEIHKVLEKECQSRKQSLKMASYAKRQFYSLLFGQQKLCEPELIRRAEEMGVTLSAGPFSVFFLDAAGDTQAQRQENLMATGMKLKQLPGVMHTSLEGELLCTLMEVRDKPPELDVGQLVRRVGFSNRFSLLCETQRARQEAKMALYFCRVLGKRKLLCRDEAALWESTASISALLEKELMQAIADNSQNGVTEALSVFFECLTKKTSADFYRACAPLAVLFQKVCTVDEIARTESLVFDLKNAQNLKDMQAVFLAHFLHLIQQDEKTAQRTSNLIIDRVMAYIEAHYAEDITLKAIADEVYVNPIYLSRLFKENTGISYIDHLTETRVRHAKRLLRDLSLRIYDIASMVGYERKHFGKVFKERTGLTPKEYRNKTTQQ